MKIKSRLFFLSTRFLRWLYSLQSASKLPSFFRASMKANAFSKTPAESIIESFIIEGIACEKVTPVKSNIDNKKLVVYFHGGAFIGGNLDSHRDIVFRIANSLGCPAIHVDYALSPESHYTTAIEQANNVVRSILEDDNIDIYIAGDSAGAHLALNSAIECRKKDKIRILGLYLISPFLDLTCQMARITKSHYGTHDAVMSLDFLEKAKKNYASDKIKASNLLTEINEYRLQGIDNIAVTVGKNEILRFESESFIRLIEDCDKTYFFDCIDNMPHAFPVCSLFVSEGNEAIVNACSFLKSHV